MDKQNADDTQNKVREYKEAKNELQFYVNIDKIEEMQCLMSQARNLYESLPANWQKKTLKYGADINFWENCLREKAISFENITAEEEKRIVTAFAFANYMTGCKIKDFDITNQYYPYAKDEVEGYFFGQQLKGCLIGIALSITAIVFVIIFAIYAGKIIL
jgi:hypothetical protein